MGMGIDIGIGTGIGIGVGIGMGIGVGKGTGIGAHGSRRAEPTVSTDSDQASDKTVLDSDLRNPRFSIRALAIGMRPVRAVRSQKFGGVRPKPILGSAQIRASGHRTTGHGVAR